MTKKIADVALTHNGISRRDASKFRVVFSVIHVIRTTRGVCYDDAMTNESAKRQSDKFKDMAREIEADEDEKRWEERLKKVAKARPAQDGQRD